MDFVPIGYTNNSHSITSKSAVYKPDSDDGIIPIVHYHHVKGIKLRSTSGNHDYSGLTTPPTGDPSYLLNFQSTPLRRVGWSDSKNCVWLEPGATLKDVSEYLEQYGTGYMLVNVPACQNLTPVGCFCMASHGSGYSASFCDQVLEFEYLHWNSSTKSVDAVHVVRDTEEFKAWAGSMGTLGVIVRMWLKVVPLVKLRDTHNIMNSLTLLETVWRKEARTNNSELPSAFVDPLCFDQIYWTPVANKFILVQRRLPSSVDEQMYWNSLNLRGQTSGIHENLLEPFVPAGAKLVNTLRQWHILSGHAAANLVANSYKADIKQLAEYNTVHRLMEPITDTIERIQKSFEIGDDCELFFPVQNVSQMTQVLHVFNDLFRVVVSDLKMNSIDWNTSPVSSLVQEYKLEEELKSCISIYSIFTSPMEVRFLPATEDYPLAPNYKQNRMAISFSWFGSKKHHEICRRFFRLMLTVATLGFHAVPHWGKYNLLERTSVEETIISMWRETYSEGLQVHNAWRRKLDPQGIYSTFITDYLFTGSGNGDRRSIALGYLPLLERKEDKTSEDEEPTLFTEDEEPHTLSDCFVDRMSTSVNTTNREDVEKSLSSFSQEVIQKDTGEVHGDTQKLFVPFSNPDLSWWDSGFRAIANKLDLMNNESLSSFKNEVMIEMTLFALTMRPHMDPLELKDIRTKLYDAVALLEKANRQVVPTEREDCHQRGVALWEEVQQQIYVWTGYHPSKSNAESVQDYKQWLRIQRNSSSNMSFVDTYSKANEHIAQLIQESIYEIDRIKKFMENIQLVVKTQQNSIPRPNVEPILFQERNYGGMDEDNVVAVKNVCMIADRDSVGESSTVTTSAIPSSSSVLNVPEPSLIKCLIDWSPIFSAHDNSPGMKLFNTFDYAFLEAVKKKAEVEAKETEEQKRKASFPSIEQKPEVKPPTIPLFDQELFINFMKKYVFDLFPIVQGEAWVGLIDQMDATLTPFIGVYGEPEDTVSSKIFTTIRDVFLSADNFDSLLEQIKEKEGKYLSDRAALIQSIQKRQDKIDKTSHYMNLGIARQQQTARMIIPDDYIDIGPDGNVILSEEAVLVSNTFYTLVQQVQIMKDETEVKSLHRKQEYNHITNIPAYIEKFQKMLKDLDVIMKSIDSSLQSPNFSKMATQWSSLVKKNRETMNTLYATSHRPSDLVVIQSSSLRLQSHSAVQEWSNSVSSDLSMRQKEHPQMGAADFNEESNRKMPGWSDDNFDGLDEKSVPLENITVQQIFMPTGPNIPLQPVVLGSGLTAIGGALAQMNLGVCSSTISVMSKKLIDILNYFSNRTVSQLINEGVSKIWLNLKIWDLQNLICRWIPLLWKFICKILLRNKPNVFFRRFLNIPIIRKVGIQTLIVLNEIPSIRNMTIFSALDAVSTSFFVLMTSAWATWTIYNNSSIIIANGIPTNSILSLAAYVGATSLHTYLLQPFMIRGSDKQTGIATLIDIILSCLAAKYIYGPTISTDCFVVPPVFAELKVMFYSILSSVIRVMFSVWPSLNMATAEERDGKINLSVDSISTLIFKLVQVEIPGIAQQELRQEIRQQIRNTKKPSPSKRQHASRVTFNDTLDQKDEKWTDLDEKKACLDEKVAKENGVYETYHRRAEDKVKESFLKLIDCQFPDSAQNKVDLPYKMEKTIRAGSETLMKYVMHPVPSIRRTPHTKVSEFDIPSGLHKILIEEMTRWVKQTRVV